MKRNEKEHLAKKDRRCNRRIILGSIIALTLAIFGAYTAGYTSGRMQNVTPQVQEAAVDIPLVSAVNNYRATHGKPPLKENTGLSQSAQVRADEIALHGRAAWNHTRPDGTSWVTATYPYVRFPSASENLVECAVSNSHAVETWSGSDAHNQNMIGVFHGQEWTDIGTAHAWDNNNKCMVFVAHFGR